MLATPAKPVKTITSLRPGDEFVVEGYTPADDQVYRLVAFHGDCSAYVAVIVDNKIVDHGNISLGTPLKRVLRRIDK